MCFENLVSDAYISELKQKFLKDQVFKGHSF